MATQGSSGTTPTGIPSGSSIDRTTTASAGTLAGQDSGRPSASAGNAGGAARREEVASKAHDTVDRMASAMHHATDRMSSKGGQWMDQQDRWLDQARTYARNQPMAALGIAFAAGFVLSRIMR